MKIGRATKSRYKVPEWTWSQDSINQVKEQAKEANITTSRFIEKAVSNFFLLHSKDISKIQGKSQDHKNKRVSVPSWSMHEDVMIVLENTASKQNCYMGNLVEYIVNNHIKLYGKETDFFKIIKTI